MWFSNSIPFLMYVYTKASTPTWSKTPSYPHTQRVTLCRHNVVVGGVSSELLGEGDGALSTWDIGGVPIVGVGLVCTIVNGTDVFFLRKSAFHNCAYWVSGVNTNHKVTKVSVTYGKRKCNPIQWCVKYTNDGWIITQVQILVIKIALITMFHSNNI